MSSKASTTELKSISPRVIARLKMEEKPRLVRSSSIEKIRRFNSFICSQQYLILPALLSWLKSSQSGLQSSTERTIFLFRSLLFNTFFYKLYAKALKSATPTVSKAIQIQRDAKLAFVSIISNFHKEFSKLFRSTFLLALAVYCACAAVVLQLFVAAYLMYLAFLPYGFIFLSACIGTINYLCYRTMHFFIEQSNRKRCCK